MKGYTISIVGRQTSPGEEDERFELITEGSFTHSGGESRISYEESSITGRPGTETLFVIEPSRITLTRGSWYGGDMVFDMTQKHHFLYQTPFGSLTMGVDTEMIRHELNDCGGDLHIEYALDVDNTLISRNSFDISIKPAV